jgi:hypothetical protein
MHFPFYACVMDLGLVFGCASFAACIWDTCIVVYFLVLVYCMSCYKFSFFISTLTCIIYTIHRIILGEIPTQDGSRNAYTFISGRWVGVSLSHRKGQNGFVAHSYHILLPVQAFLL